MDSLFKTVMAGGGGIEYWFVLAKNTGFVIGGAMGMFLSGMRYDAPGAFALPGVASPEALNELKWHRQLYLGLKDMGSQGLRTARVCKTHEERS
jgi:hypothetical protein